MNKKQNAKEVETDRLARKLAKLVEIFRRGKPADDFNWWQGKTRKSLFYPLYGYQDGQPLFEEVVQGVLKLNSEMLSEHEIETKIIFDFLQTQTISWTEAEHLNNQSLVDEAKKFLNKLAEFEAWQDLDISIGSFHLEGAPVKIGNVTFMRVTEQELELWKRGLGVLWDSKTRDVLVVARVRAPGDRYKALSYAETCVNQALDVFRAFCFPFAILSPFGRSDSWQVEIGDIRPSSSTPIRIGNSLSAMLGAGSTQIELRKNVFSKLEQSQWTLINKLVAKKSPNIMEDRLLTCIHWLSTSTKPDTDSAKFIKICIALETLLGREPHDEDLKVRGITAMLAERAAFIAGMDVDDRILIDKDIREYYGKRSGIVHGDETEVSLDDINNFGELVRRLALALLEKLDELGDEIGGVKELEKWVKVQKYTLPERNSKEVT